MVKVNRDRLCDPKADCDMYSLPLSFFERPQKAALPITNLISLPLEKKWCRGFSFCKVASRVASKYKILSY